MKRKIISLIALLTVSTASFAESESIRFKPNTFEKTQEQKDKEAYDWMFNPMSSHVTREQWEDILNENEENRIKELEQKRFGQAKVITIDTRDKESCVSIQSRLRETSSVEDKSIDELCSYDSQNPYVSVMVKDEYQTEGISFNEEDGFINDFILDECCSFC